MVNFLFSPLLSRLYSPESFGVFGTFVSLASIFTAGVTLQYSQSIILPKENQSAFELLLTSIIAVFFISISCFFLLFIIPNKYIPFIFQRDFLFFCIMMFLFVCITGLNLSFQSWCIRKKKFKVTSSSNVVRSITAIIFQLGLGFVDCSVWGLIVGSLIGLSLGSVNLFKIFLQDIIFLEPTSVQRLKTVAREYIDFPLYSAPQSILNAISQGIPVLLLSNFYDLSVVGFYAFGVKILQVPMAVVRNALRQVLFQKVSEVYNSKKKIMPLYLKSTLALFLCGLLPTLGLFFFAEDIYSFLFGERWREAGLYSSWIVLWMFFAFCNVPSTLCSRVLRKQRVLLIYDTILLFARVSGIVMFGMISGPLVTVIAISMIGVVFNLIYIVYIYFIVLSFEKKRAQGCL